MPIKAQAAAVIFILFALAGRAHGDVLAAENTQLAAVSEALALRVEMDIANLIADTTGTRPTCPAADRRTAQVHEAAREECIAEADAAAFQERGGLVPVNAPAGVIAASIGASLREAERNDGVVLTGPRPDDGTDGGSFNVSETVDCVYRDAMFVSSANGSDGGVFVNQDAGRLNNPVNELAVHTSSALQGAALSERDLSQWNTGNRLHGSTKPRVGRVRDVVRNALNDNAGLAAGNQTAGALANQGNRITFTPVTAPRQPARPGGGGL